MAFRSALGLLLALGSFAATPVRAGDALPFAPAPGLLFDEPRELHTMGPSPHGLPGTTADGIGSPYYYRPVGRAGGTYGAYRGFGGYATVVAPWFGGTSPAHRLGGYGAGDVYTDHFGPGFHRHRAWGHVRFPYYGYRRPWYHVGPPVDNADTNLPW